MTTLQDYIAQRDDLEIKIKTIQQEEKQKAIELVRSIIDTHNLKTSDLIKGTQTAQKEPGSKIAGKKIAAKYRSSTGEEWSGRGLQPKWLKALVAQGEPLESFRI